MGTVGVRWGIGKQKRRLCCHIGLMIHVALQVHHQPGVLPGRRD